MSNRKELANAIRVLSMDAIQKANSGHPGAPMGMADIAEVLWNDYLVHNPANPKWANRDRFILSNGHGSMLLYSLLHLSGYDVSIDDLKQFRQLHSKTPGHPEHGMTPGVESTSGPLGQGIACAVGMAVAEKVMAAQYNRDGHTVMDHYTYVFMGDGCMMEGLSHEACSLAGNLQLGKLIVFYDDNGISIDGCVDGWFSDDTPRRFEAYGWHVVPAVDGHDGEAIKDAIEKARRELDRPTLICCKTVIGQGAPNVCGTAKCHGAPLGEEEIRCTREAMNWPHGPFEIPKLVYSAWGAKGSGFMAEDSWNGRFKEYEKAYPQLADEFRRRMEGDLPDEFISHASNFVDAVDAKEGSLANRKSSQNGIEGLAPVLPEFFGGSADLAGSNLTRWSGSKTATPADWNGNYMNYGVREFAMSVMMNGMVLHGGFIPYGGTFLVFSDYARNAMRMSALMGLRVLYVLTHDSIGVGEDGPTHQPVEHVESLRLIPNMDVWRPCDGVESSVAWEQAIKRTDGPSSLIMSRQTLPHQTRSSETIDSVSRGGYVLRHCNGTPNAILIATGSEVSLAMEAAMTLESRGHQVRVVSMPCTAAFERQSVAYRDEVLLPHVTARVAVEAGVTSGWGKYVGLNGAVLGMDRFGESAPGNELFDYFGFTEANLVALVEQVIDGKRIAA